MFMFQYNDPNRPDILQKVTIPTVTDQECRNSYGPTDMFGDFFTFVLIFCFYITLFSNLKKKDTFICAGVPEGKLLL